MPSHDQLSKSLIKLFFTEFLGLIDSESASLLRAGEAIFLDKEDFTDWPAGDRREMDLAAGPGRQRGDQGHGADLVGTGRSRSEPIAWAFAALMRPGRWSRAELKLECLRRIATSDVVGLRKQVLVDWVETYVQLSGQNALELQRLLDLEGNEEIKAMELTWLGQAEARGIEQGIEKGLQKGIAQGAETATRQAVDRMRHVVFRQIEQRFGAVPARVRRKIDAIDSLEPLASLAERVLLVTSVGELSLD